MKALGLSSRRRKNGQALYWVAASVSRRAKGYPTPTIRIHSTDEAEIREFCARYTQELRAWLEASNRAGDVRCDGTVAGLIRFYQQHQESPYRAVKFNTRAMYDESLKILEKAVGRVALANIQGSDFRRWYRNLRQPRIEGQPDRIRRAYKAMQLTRIVVSFGITEGIPHCARLKGILDEMTFEKPAARTVFVTFEQSLAIIDMAKKMGRPSIAVAQALQFELTLRQVDVIGQWEKGAQGTLGIGNRGQGWSGGLVWSDIDADGVLRKKTTKTGQEAIHDTTIYPLVRSCLDLIPAARRVGPIVINEETNLPYRYRNFADVWREIATKAGVPADVWNRDSRAGGVTEGTDAGVELELMRHHANHSTAATTAIYSRKTLEKTRAVAVKRVAARATSKT